MEVSNDGSQRVLKVFLGNKECGHIAVDVWCSLSVSFCRNGAFVWGGVRAFRLRNDSAVEQFAIDDEIHQLFSLPGNILLVCELSVRLLDDNFKELDRYMSDDVLFSGWWEGDVLHVHGWPPESPTEISFVIEGGQLKLIADAG